MAAKPDPKAGDDTGGKKKGKGLLIAIIATVLLAGGGGAGWFLTRPAATEKDEAGLAPKKAVPTVFLTLDSFTLNLADAGGDRMAQIGLSLELESPQVEAQIMKSLPVIRNTLLLLISSQESKTLLTLDGKLALADEVAVRVGMVLGWQPEEPEPIAQPERSGSARPVANRRAQYRPTRPNPVVAVHFAQFLIQ